jgi:purine nucleosidase
MVLREDPEAFRLLKEIVVMGGAIEERGNVTATAEFNIFADPRAAREVIHSGIEITLVGLDVTHRVEFTRDRLDSLLGDRTDPRARFVRCLCDQLFSFYRPRLGREVFFPHDPLAVAVALDRSLVETRAMRVDVETAGELTRGMVVVERRPWIQEPANVHVCVKVDAPRFLELFCRRTISPGPSGATTPTRAGNRPPPIAFPLRPSDT